MLKGLKVFFDEESSKLAKKCNDHQMYGAIICDFIILCVALFCSVIIPFLNVSTLLIISLIIAVTMLTAVILVRILMLFNAISIKKEEEDKRLNNFARAAKDLF